MKSEYRSNLERKQFNAHTFGGETIKTFASRIKYIVRNSGANLNGATRANLQHPQPHNFLNRSLCGYAVDVGDLHRRLPFKFAPEAGPKYK